MLTWRRITKLHLVTATLATYFDLDVCHGGILALTLHQMIIPGIVLAGGRSSRMGRPKALLPAPMNHTFVSRVVRTLRDGGVDDVVVVVGADGPVALVSEALSGEDRPPRLVVNPEPALGQLSSLLIGLRTVDHPGVAAMLMTLVDMPLVSAKTVRVVIDAYRRTRAPVVRPARNGRHGHPVIFDRTLFSELRQAEVSTGAKAVLRTHRTEILDVAVEDDGAFLDIDTPDDYERAFGRPFGSGTGNDR